MKILIPNATSPKNLGDQAMLEVLLAIIKLAHPDAKIIVHSFDSALQKILAVAKVDETLYSFCVFDNKSWVSRLFRISCLFSFYFLNKFGLNFFPHSRLQQLVNDYIQADRIIFVGGGYLRSQKGITQSLNLLMLAAMFKFASLSKAKTIVSPISFGPFAYKWQERLCAWLLKKFDFVSVREIYSYEVLKKYLPAVVLLSDLALLTPPSNRILNSEKLVVGFTMRKWLRGVAAQAFLESSVVEALADFAQSTGAIIQPIVQVDAPEFGDQDLAVVKRMRQALVAKSVSVREIKKAVLVKEAKQIYAGIDMLLGMRMHSNILAATQGTPFIAISYEHKTEGIARDLGLEKFCVKAEKVNKQNILAMLNDLYVNRQEILDSMSLALKKIQLKNKDYLLNIIK